MTQRIDYWRGFTGGFLAGVAVGSLIYFSQDLTKKIAEEEEDRHLAHDEQIMENTAGASLPVLGLAESGRTDFEIQRQRRA